jgi:agmatinase
MISYKERNPLKNVLEKLEPLFKIPEKTRSGCGFADLLNEVSFQDSEFVIYGVPIDLTTSFGKGTCRGPEAIRLTSARQIETFIFEEDKDIQNCARIYDLGDLKVPFRNSSSKYENRNSQRDSARTNAVFSFLDEYIPSINRTLYDNHKIPVIIGGEHTLSYYAIKAFSKEKPVVIHLDAHRDIKHQYGGRDVCHTTPFFKLMNEGYVQGSDLIQIGIRQSDEQENKTAKDYGVITFDAWDVHYRFENVLNSIAEMTKKRKMYISFDIDVYDIPYVPCTGTPEPFGLNPFQVLEIIQSLNSSADLIGIDMVEVSVKNDDYREGTLAAQTLFRILCRKFGTVK